MGNQLVLFEGISDSKFIQYHKSNKHLYILFKKFTFQAIIKGFKNYSSKGIFEQIRWETGAMENGGSFKINNNYTAFYARMFMNEYPEHSGFFRLRGSKADCEDLSKALTV